MPEALVNPKMDECNLKHEVRELFGNELAHCLCGLLENGDLDPKKRQVLIENVEHMVFMERWLQQPPQAERAVVSEKGFFSALKRWMREMQTAVRSLARGACSFL